MCFLNVNVNDFTEVIPAYSVKQLKTFTSTWDASVIWYAIYLPTSQNDHNPPILDAKSHWYGGIGAIAKKIVKILSLHRRNVQKVQQNKFGHQFNMTMTPHQLGLTSYQNRSLHTCIGCLAGQGTLTAKSNKTGAKTLQSYLQAIGF